MELAAARLFRAKWTDEIHEEWITNLLENRSDLNREKLERTRDLMNQAVTDCLVDGYQGLIPSLKLPDPNDRHVLAAAVKSGCDAIVTFNLKDFPDDIAKQYGIDIRHPDDFIDGQFDREPAKVLMAAKNCRARLQSPPKTALEYLQTLEAQGLPKTVDLLIEYAPIL